MRSSRRGMIPRRLPHDFALSSDASPPFSRCASVLAPGLKLDPLWKLLAKKHLIMHGSDFDLRLLHDLCRFQAHSLFDTMLAAQLLGLPRIGLASLLDQHFGVALDKDGQKANWSKRPLTAKLLNYAAL